jgi:metal-responsive CopG/Arc/MetJ family transcriptional regulator
MFGPSVKIDKEMWRRIEQCAAKAGYSSPEEFVHDVLEREVQRLEAEATDMSDEMRRQLKGLGYLE